MRRKRPSPAYADLTRRLSVSVHMTDPLLWLDGDPTDGRRARPHEPVEEARTEPLPPPPYAHPPRRSGRFTSALAGGLVSAVLVGGGAFALGWVGDDGGTSSAAVQPGPALVGAKQTGDVAAIYAAARNSVVSIKTSSGSGTGFVVEAGGTIGPNAHVVGSESTVQVQFADDESVSGRVTGVDRSSDLAVVKVSTSRT